MARIVCGRCEHRHVIETLGAAVFWSALRERGQVARPVSRVLLAEGTGPSTRSRLREPVAALPPARDFPSVFDQLAAFQQEV